jgi:lysophospholipase L1-like esterase
LRIASGPLLLAIGLLTASCGGDSPTAPSGPPAAGSTINYAALGASDVIGFGSSVPCLPFTDCPGGTGYVFVAGRQLRAQGFTVRVDSLGLPGVGVSRRFQDLGVRYGRDVPANLIDGQVPFVRSDVTMATIFTGANDVNVITAALGGGAGGTDAVAYIDQQVGAFREDFNTLVDRLRSRAPAARLVILNVPNLGALPLLAGASAAQRQAAQRASVGITTAINGTASDGVRIIDVMCDSRLYLRSSLYADGFHPNDAGYTLLAAEVVRAATAASYPAPQRACAAMTTIP